MTNDKDVAVFPTEGSADLTAAVVAAGSAAVRLAACSPPAQVAAELSRRRAVRTLPQACRRADDRRPARAPAGHDRYRHRSAQLAGWGIVAAPRYIGRLTGAIVLYKFPRGGTSAVAPHIGRAVLIAQHCRRSQHRPGHAWAERRRRRRRVGHRRRARRGALRCLKRPRFPASGSCSPNSTPSQFPTKRAGR